MTAPGGFVAGDILGAGDMNALPGGVNSGGLVLVTSNITGMGGSSPTDITGMSVTWTADASRMYRTSFYMKVSTLTYAWTDVDRSPKVLITDGSNTQITFAGVQGLYSESTDIFDVSCSVVESGLSGSTTRKLRGQYPSGGSDTFAVYAGATYPSYLLVEDIGPA